MLRILQITICFFALNLSAQSSHIKTISSNVNSLHLKFITGKLQFDQISADTKDFTHISAAGLTKSYDIGNPDLPVYSKLIEVPTNGAISVEILNSSEKRTDLAALGFHQEVLPSQHSVFKNQDPTKVPFQYNESTYLSNNFYSQNLVTIERVGVMRGKSIARIQIAPLSYNPLTNELLAKKEVELKVNFENSITITPQALRTQDFDVNFSKLLNKDLGQKQAFSSNTTRMIILSDPEFEEDLQPFIQWKIRKGFDVIEAYKGQAEVGETKESMKSYVQSFYDNATEENPAPTYLLIVGDHEQIPSFDAGNHVSDMFYCEFDGNGDYLPEMIFGRFSASTRSELEIQINKTLQYEQFTMSDPSYLEEVLLVAGVDGNFAPIHGNGQINYGTDYYFNEAHNLTSYVYLYPETESNAVENAIIEHVSDGVGFANYTAHCGPGGWSDPSFEVSDVAGLTNEDQYGLMVGNCCQSNTFNGVTCFGEALLRKSKGGAVGYIGGSDNTLWDEDYFWSVGAGPISANPNYQETGLAIYDCSFHENNEQSDDWSITQGQLFQSGNWAVSESASSQAEYYWEIYHLMGDPSVLTYYGMPSDLMVSHPSALSVGMSSISVSTEQYTYVAISQNGVLLDASYTDETGNIVLSFEPISTMSPLEIVATKHNKKVYTGIVNTMSSDAPYVTCSSISLNEGELGDIEAAINQTFVLDMSLQNYGSVDATGLTIDVTTSNPNVTISYSELLLASISAQSVINMNGLVTVELNNNFADQELVNLIFTITDAEGSQWFTNNSFLVNAPELEFSSHSLSNSNSTIALGETVEITFILNNIGHATSTNGSVVVSSDLPELSINQNNLLFSSIGASLQVLVTVPVTLNPDAPLGETYSISLTALSDAGLSTNYTATFTTPNCPTESSEVQINLVTDYYPNETSWVLLNSDGETIGQVGSDELESGQSYTDIFCVNMNTYYTFEIQDDFGDGLLSGGYSIVICGETIASGAQFGDGETINFISGCDQTLAVGCTDPLYTNYSIDAVVDDGSCESLIIGLTELENRIRIYPNPAKSKLNIQLGSLEVASISIYQMEGKQIREYTDLADAELEINISDLDAGFYHIKVKLQSGQTISKSIIVM